LTTNIPGEDLTGTLCQSLAFSRISLSLDSSSCTLLTSCYLATSY